MGFFSGLSRTLFGGTDSSQQQSSGYNALPTGAKSNLDYVSSQAANLLKGQNGTNMFTPIGITNAEQSAFNLEQPLTQQGVQDLTNNYLNPYLSDLMKQIGQQYSAGNSAYQTQLASAGQNGSNRDFLNTAYNDQLQTQAIGTALANEYNTALNAGLTQKQQDITNLLNQGSTLRSLDLQTKQAPLSALQALGSTTSYYPSTSQGSQQSSTDKGIFGLINALLG